MEPRGIFARKDAAKEALVTRRASECVLWSLLSAADRLVAKFNIGTPVILTRLYLLVESRSSDRADCINVFYLALAVGPEIADKFVSDVLGPAEPLESVSIENFLVVWKPGILCLKRWSDQFNCQSACLDAGMTTKCYPKLWPMFVSPKVGMFINA
ncbi:hypothetical protein BD311DRAFT_837003 [Dichomitus squalens]|uniref:Uncharacterized protein n=1 Tax=Dichomitus squalens TaxID=114155 RepID=A0A4Q9MND4_9APHY|nr:hypothetical protein BD311DRAFT_837003 [Dichomitus squalens]